MKKIFIFSILIFITTMNIFALNESEFNKNCYKIWGNILVIHLDDTFEVLINRDCIEKVYFDQDKFDINEPVINLNEKVWYRDEPEPISGKIISFLDPNGNECIIGYEGGPSPHCETIYVTGTDLNYDESSYIYKICIPSKNSIYTVNLGYNKSVVYTTKLNFSNNGYYEINQPMYYINENSIANDSIALYDNESMDKQIATVAKGTVITVVGFNKWKVLIKSGVGLMGWAEVKTIEVKNNSDGSMQYKSNIEYFNNTEY